MRGVSRNSLVTAQERLAGLVGDEPQVMVRLADELFATVGILDRQGALRRALSDPGLPAAQRAALAEGLFGPRVGPETAALLETAVRAAWSESGDLVDAVEFLAIQAVLAGAEIRGELDDVEDELFRFARIVVGSPELRAALTERGVEPGRKAALVESLLAHRAPAATVRLVVQAVTQPRGRTLERALAEFARQAAARRDRLTARVTSAATLDPGTQENIGRALGAAYGRGVRPQFDVDPRLIGGVTVRVADEIIDGSVLNRLREARRALAG